MTLDTHKTVKPIEASDLPPAPARLSSLALVFRLVLIALVLGAAVALTFWMLGSKPKSKPRPKARTAPLVEVAPVRFDAHSIRIPAMGTVIAARDLELRPEVSGRIIELSDSFEPGGLFARGELLLRLDPRDYELEVTRRQSALERAQSELLLEQGNQIVARREMEFLGQNVSPEEEALMLRQPQLLSLQAAVASARADLKRARLDLSRTELRAPFNAVVVEKVAELGGELSGGSQVARLAGTDAFWVEASIPVNQLSFMDIPGASAQVRLSLNGQSRQSRIGRVIRRLPALEQQGRMARILVEIIDPLELAAKKGAELLLGSYVHLEIVGRPLDRALELPRELLRDRQSLWVLAPDGTLDIRPVEIAFRNPDHVLISGGVQDGESIIVSDLSAPVQGMPLRAGAASAAGEQP